MARTGPNQISIRSSSMEVDGGSGRTIGGHKQEEHMLTQKWRGLWLACGEPGYGGGRATGV